MTDGIEPGPVRGHHGKFDKDPRAAERSRQALDLRLKSMHYADIGKALGVSASTAHRAVQRGLKGTYEEAAEELRKLELAKLDALERVTLAVLESQHVVVSAGKVAMLDGSPVPDSGPVLAAVGVLLQVATRRAKLLGLDSPAKVTLDGGVRYEVVGVDTGKLT